jgi:hypothetical protein
MPTTSGGIRYPASTASINIPQDMQYLAEDVQTYINANALTAAGVYTLTNKKIGSTGLTFSGSSGQTVYTTTVQATIPTGNNTVTIPNASGTVSLISLAETLSNKTFASTLAVAGSASGTTVLQAQNVASGTIQLPTSDGTIALTSDLGNSEMLLIMSVYGA